MFVFSDKELVLEKPADVTSVNEEGPYLPPRDKHASSIEQVYKIHDLISPDILRSLEVIAEEILQSDILKLATDDR